MTANLEVVPDAPAAQAGPKIYQASIFARQPVSSEFAELIVELERLLDRKVWLLVQNGEDDEWGSVTTELYRGFRDQEGQISSGEKVALLLHSPGGQADCAYKIIRLFQRRVEDFITIVPCYAKSAATLMAIGGKKILMGIDAELGPVDVQLYDEEKDTYESALNAVQSLERLNVNALTALDQVMQLLISRTGKKPDALMGLACTYATSIIRPLMEKIDTIDLTRKSRELKVAEDYAVRLMRGHYTPSESQHIAASLVARYSTHGFAIDRTEVGNEGPGSRKSLNLGLHLLEAELAVEQLFTKLVPHLEKMNIIGRIVEKTHVEA